MANNYKSLYSGREVDDAVKRSISNANNIQANKEEYDAHQTAKVLDHPDGSVTSEKIADSGVTTAKIADEAVTTEKIQDGAVTRDKLAPDSVTSGKIKEGSVGTPHIIDKSITTKKLADGAVTEEKIAKGAVTEPKIADGAVTTEKIADESILEKHLSTEALERIDTNKFDGVIHYSEMYDFDKLPVYDNYPLVYKIHDTDMYGENGGLLIVSGFFGTALNLETGKEEPVLETIFQTKIDTHYGTIEHRHSLGVYDNRATAWSDWESEYATQDDVTKIWARINNVFTPAGVKVHTTETTLLILNSSTEGSTKRFGLTIDDSGTISVSEIDDDIVIEEEIEFE